MRGYRVYQDLWKPSIGEKFVAKREFNNPMDKHAVKVVKGDETVGHFRVGHLILRALAIRASNPQNALERISFHSPKNSPPPRHSNHFSLFFYFN